MGEWANALINAFLIDMNNQLKPVFRRHLVAKFDHFVEFPCGIDMHQREGRRGRVNALRARCSKTDESLPME